MKYFFLIESIFGIICASVGNVHVLWAVAICLLMATAIHLDDRKNKKEKTDFFD